MEWSSSATVIEKRRDPEGKQSDSYHIQKDDGGMCLRSGRFLKIKKDHAKSVISHMCARVKLMSSMKTTSMLVKKKVRFSKTSPVSGDHGALIADCE